MCHVAREPQELADTVIDPAATVERKFRTASGSVRIPSRADQPGPILDPELRLLVRSLGDYVCEPLIEQGAWDAGFAIVANALGWSSSGILVPLTVGAAVSCAAGSGAWKVCSSTELSDRVGGLVVVRVPHWLGRIGVEWLVHGSVQALRPGGYLVVVGDRARGVESVRSRVIPLVGRIVERAIGEHRRLYVYECEVDDPPPLEFGWITRTTLHGREVVLHHHPTLFSAGRVDPATKLLAGALPDGGGRWLDLGCGNGVLSAVAARDDRSLTASDWSYAAVLTTQRTLEANAIRAEVVVGDLLPCGDREFDVVLCYPPLHVGCRVDHGPAARLVRAARDCLDPAGELRIVLTSAQSATHLLKGSFSKVVPMASRGGFCVFSCRHPILPKLR